MIKSRLSYPGVLFAWFILLSPPLMAVSAYEDKDAIVVSDGVEVRRVVMPEEMRGAKSYKMRVQLKSMLPSLARDRDIYNNHPALRTETGTKPDVSTLIFQAKQLFKKKKYSAVMNLLDRAEAIEPKNTTVKVMKGSLFLKQGMPQDARKFWAEAVKIDPSLTEVKVQLDSLGGAE